MTIPAAIIGFVRSAIACIRRYQLLVLLLVILGLLALVTSALLADPAPMPSADAPESADHNRSCITIGTPFSGIWSIDALVRKFKKDVSGVVEERLRILSTPSRWTCPIGTDDPGTPTMEKLQALARELPGWSVEYRIAGLVPVRERKPVTFENFSSILLEYNREYQCQLDAISSQHYAAAAAAGQIQSYSTQQDLYNVSAPYARRAEQESKRGSRTILRVLNILRSYDFQYAQARDLMCYARASLDLRGEFSLLADAVSCMPKIWDSATSLHDPVPPAKP